MDKTMLALSPRTKSIEDSIKVLNDNGFEIQTISVILKEETDVPSSYLQKMELIDDVVGSRLGISAVSTPEINNIMIGGPIASYFGVLSEDELSDGEQVVTGPLAGGLLNAFMDIGIDEDTAKLYVGAIQSGEILLGVTINESREDEVLDLFDKEKMKHVSVIQR